MKYIVYRTTNQLNGMIYVGVHQTMNPDVFDGYLGSGYFFQRALKKYGKNNFIREILHVFEVVEDAYDEERKIVNKSFIERKDTYNLCGGGFGASYMSEETKIKMGKSHLGEKNHNYGKTFSDKTLRRMSDANKGEKNYWFGKHHTEESKQKMKESCKGRIPSPETIRGVIESNTLPNKIILQRRRDIQSDLKLEGWRNQLAVQWGLSLSAVSGFIRKYASDLIEKNTIYPKISPESIEQRRRDVQNSVQIRGWKSKLARKWKIDPVMTGRFINKHALDLIEVI